jgi:hypothetical protein
MSLRLNVPSEEVLGKGKGLKKPLIAKMEDMLKELQVRVREAQGG